MIASRKKIIFWAMFLSLSLGPAAAAFSDPPATFTNSLGQEFLLIKAGSFTMGSDNPKATHENPPHKVKISRPFYLGRYEVTQEQWQAVMGNNPSEFKDNPTHPVERVSWVEVQEFIRRLNEKEGHDRYRLPTEAEWEYAARAGTTGLWSCGAEEEQLKQHGWYKDNSGDATHPVGQKKPNPWGLYDMHGNVREWVADWYGEGYYAVSPADDPPGPASGTVRVFRGGCWNCFPMGLQSPNRGKNPPDEGTPHIGFRLALSPE